MNKTNKSTWQKYYDNNKEKIREYHRKYYQENKERIRNKRLENPEYSLKIKQYNKLYRENNKEKIAKYFKEWYMKNKSKKNKVTEDPTS